MRIGVCAALVSLTLAPAAANDLAEATAVPNVLSYCALPKAFDPARAPAAAIGRLGLPPRPDRSKQPEAYAAWLRDVSPDIERVTPRLREAATRRKAVTRLGGPGWSGIVLKSDVTRYGPNSFQQVHGAWTMPSVRMPSPCPRNGTRPVHQVGIWPGIGGFQTNSLLQAGSASEVACADGVLQSRYWNWFEFYPNPPTTIENLPLEPGDAMSVYVWSTSATRGHAHLVNRSQKKSVSLSYAAPAKNPLIGYSVEWVVEQPGNSSGGHFPLPNYGEVVIHEATGSTGAGLDVTPGGNFAADDIETINVTMTTKPDGKGAPLSIAKVIGDTIIRFRPQGPAR